MSRALFEAKNWSATKEALVDGLQGQRKTTMEVVLENTKYFLVFSRTTYIVVLR